MKMTQIEKIQMIAVSQADLKASTLQGINKAALGVIDSIVAVFQANLDTSKS